MRLVSSHVTTDFGFNRLDGSLRVGCFKFVLCMKSSTCFSFSKRFTSPLRYSLPWSVLIFIGRELSSNAGRLPFPSPWGISAEQFERNGRKRQSLRRSIHNRRCLWCTISKPRSPHPTDNWCSGRSPCVSGIFYWSDGEGRMCLVFLTIFLFLIYPTHIFRLFAQLDSLSNPE